MWKHFVTVFAVLNLNIKKDPSTCLSLNRRRKIETRSKSVPRSVFMFCKQGKGISQIKISRWVFLYSLRTAGETFSINFEIYCFFLFNSLRFTFSFYVTVFNPTYILIKLLHPLRIVAAAFPYQTYFHPRSKKRFMPEIDLNFSKQFTTYRGQCKKRNSE